MASRRCHYDAAFKRNVITDAEALGNCAAGRKHGVPENNVRRWRKEKEALFACAATRKAFRGPRKGVFPEVEASLTEFVRQTRSRALTVTTEMLQLKAREFAKDRGISGSQFKASRGWVQKYMKRAGFSLRRRTSITQKLPRDYEEKLLSFQRYVIGLRRERNFLLSQIGNADETPIFFDMPSAQTVHTKGDRQVHIRTAGCEKARITVMLACTADGHKLPPYVVLKRKTMPKNENFPKGVHIRCQEKGWMTEALVMDWIKTVWCRRPGALLARQSMLVLDAFRGHLSEGVKKKLQEEATDLVVIPGGMTSQLQPLDVCLNKPFKDHVRRLYNEWMASDETALTPSGRLKRASPSVVARWIADAWAAIPDAMVAASFKKCCISNSLDGTDDSEVWECTSNKESSDASDDDSS